MADYGDEVDEPAAMLALLYAQSDITTYPATAGGPTTVPAGATPPYRSVHFTTEPVNGDRMDTKSTRFRTRAYVHHVGANDAAARVLVKRTRAAWLDVVPTVSGRNCFPIRGEPTREPQPTEPVALTTVTITAVYRLETVPGEES